MYTVSFVFLSFQEGIGDRLGGTTGAPIEQGSTCGQSGCHSAGIFNPRLSLQMEDSEGNLIDNYRPGDEYIISIIVNTSSPAAGYGFQMVCLDDSNEAANGFSDFPPYVSDFMIEDKQYVQQNRRLPVGFIPMKWKAPEEVHSVTFYIAANAVNGNDSPLGDGGTHSSFTYEAASSTVQEQSNISTIYPNPTSDLVRVNSDIPIRSLSLYNSNGEKVHHCMYNSISLEGMQSGYYILQIDYTTGASGISKIIKI